MGKHAPLTSILCGVSGEYFVAAELSRRGYVASITLRNTRGIDIVASNAEATRSVAIQVKTNQRGASEWVLNQKVETMDLAENLYFVFVTLNGHEQPAYHIVPRADVVRFVTESHRKWLATPGRRGQLHRDSTMRKFKDPDGLYMDRWDLLRLDAVRPGTRRRSR